MKKFSIVLVLFVATSLVASNVMAKGGNTLAQQWISAMMHGGEGINSIITPDFEYTQYSFEYGNRLFKGKKGNIPFFAKTSRPTEINIEEVNTGYGGQIVKLNAVAETGLYRDWDIILFIKPGGISKVTEIAKEGTFEGYPEGCPETAFKRDLIVTLHGTPAGFDGPKAVKLYSLRIDSDPLDYAHPEAEEKDLKKCKPKPDTYLIEEEVAVFGSDGQMEHADTVGNKYKGSGSENAYGATYFDEDGINFPGRLFNIGDGKEGLMLTFSVERGSGSSRERIDPAILYTWKGSGWSSIWSFTAGFGSMEGFMGSATKQVEWSLKSTMGAGGVPAIVARLETNDGNKFNCPVGTTIVFNKSGSGFKPDRSSVPGSCFGGPGASAGSLKSHGKGYELPKVKHPRKEVEGY